MQELLMLRDLWLLPRKSSGSLFLIFFHDFSTKIF